MSRLNICKKCRHYEIGCYLECKEWHIEQQRLAIYRAEVWHKKFKRYLYRHKIASYIFISLFVGWIILGVFGIAYFLNFKYP